MSCMLLTKTFSLSWVRFGFKLLWCFYVSIKGVGNYMTNCSRALWYQLERAVGADVSSNCALSAVK